MIPIFLIGVTLTGLMLRQVLNQNYEAEVTAKALLAMETMNSVREYTSSRVRPELIERLKTEFLPETVPAYSAREVFEELRKQPDYQNFYYKEATLNPTNPRDQADEFETKLVQQFREQDNLNELRGFRSLPTGEIFYIAHPLKVSKPSCLECHGSVSQAPQSLIERYGQENGFNWKLNEIVGAQMVSVPASEIHQLTQQALKVTMGFVIAVLTTMIATMILINFSLQRYVVRPIKQMARAAEAISMGDLDVEFNKRYDDEVGHLTDAFARMKMSLVMAMKRLKNK
jgi:methyl-accepting chemotaxis protein